MKAYIFDVETSAKKNGEIIEAALAELAPGADLLGADPTLIDRDVRIEKLTVERFKPNSLTTGSIAVHHILPHELEACAPSWTFALPADATYLVGHSIDFDWEAAGSPSTVKRICTHAMAQHVWPDAGGYSQSALIYMLLGATDATRAMLRGAHAAAEDVQLNAIILRAILEARPSIRTWPELWTFSEDCRIPRTCPMKRYEGVPLDELDDGFIDWCLRQDWLDPYFRVGLNRVLERRYPPREDLFATETDAADDLDEIPF